MASWGPNWGRIARLLAASVLVGCGGGGVTLPAPQSALLPMAQCPSAGARQLADGRCVRSSDALGQPQAATVPPSAQITPAQLMDWAEANYPELFPAAGKTEGFSDPYTYRYYPGTRNYIGVSTAAAAVDVYLYGEVSAWSIARVGALSDFTCRVSPEACEVKRLSVSQFGSGSVLAADGQPVCSGRDCSRDYPPNTQLTLSASAASGWRLRYWSGCDSTSGAACSVKMDNHRTVHPVFERTTPVVYKPEAVQLLSTTMSQLISNQGGVLIFNNAASQIASLTAGKVIYSTVGQGLLRRVTSVISLPGGNYIVDTTDASLSDLILEGTLVLDGRSGLPQAAGGPLPPQAFASATVFLGSGDDGLSVKVELDLQPEAAFDFDLQGVTEFKFIVNPKLTLAQMQLRLKEKLLDVSKTVPLGITFSPIVLGPVVLTPTAEMEGRLKADIKVGVELSGQMAAGGALGLHYLRSTGWAGVGDFNLSGSFIAPLPTAATASGEADASFGLKAGLKLYGVAGPNLVIGPFVNAKATDTVSTGEACVRWTVRGGVRAQGEADITLLGRTLGKYEVVLAELSRTFLDGSVLKCQDKEKPSVPRGLAARALSPTQVQLTWQPSTDNVGVASYTVLRDRNGIGSEGGTSHVDSHLQPDTEYCYQVAAVDKAGNTSAESSAVCVRTPARDTQPPGAPSGTTATPLSTSSVQLSWGAPSGDATAYVIYQDGRAISQVSAPATQSRITKLSPGTRYCFSVAAIDAAGNVGAAGSAVCTTTLLNAAWTMKIKCDWADFYAVEKDVDLDVGNDQSVNVVGDATDYNGLPMAYQLYGTYAATAATLSGQINWTFSGSSAVRLDEFDARFTGADTGDVPMRQVQVTGCDAVIRFIRKGTPAAAPMAAPRGASGGHGLFNR